MIEELNNKVKYTTLTSCDRIHKKKWFIVSTFTGSEESVKISLEERIQKNSLEEHFGRILIPKVSSVRVLKSGKKKQGTTEIRTRDLLFTRQAL